MIVCVWLVIKEDGEGFEVINVVIFDVDDDFIIYLLYKGKFVFFELDKVFFL